MPQPTWLRNGRLAGNLDNMGRRDVILRPMGAILAAAIVAAILGSGTSAVAQGTTGTVRTQSYLLSTLFPDSAPANSITPQSMRDLIVTLGQGNIGIEIDMFAAGKSAASTIIPKVFSRQTVIPAGTTIKCNALAGATSATTLGLSRVSSGTTTSVGSLAFAAGGLANQGCTATFSSAVTFAVGDLLEVIFPATQDATLSGISVSIAALQ